MVNKKILEKKLENLMQTGITAYCNELGVKIVEPGDCYELPRKTVDLYFKTREDWFKIEKNQQIHRLRNYCMYHNTGKYYRYYTKLKCQY